MEEVFCKNLLEDLLLTPSPSSQEDKAINLVKAWCQSSITPTWGCGLTTVIDNRDVPGIYAGSYGTGKRKILLSGHIDVVNFRVSYIHDSGLLSIINTGGICTKSLISSQVQIMTGEGKIIDGIVTKKAIHLETSKERETVPEFSELKIDVGAENKSEVEELGIYPGCIGYYKPYCNLEFGKNRLLGTGLDDKIGVIIAYEIVKRLINDNSLGIDFFNDNTIVFAATGQEECAGSNAKRLIRLVNPDISIDFDVCFADGDLGMKKEEDGDIKLGEGGVITYGHDKSIRLANLLRDICNKNNIKYQTSATWNRGTNTNYFQAFSDYTETQLISIPLRGMHSSVEVCDWRDVESCCDMVTELVKRL